MGWKYCCKRSDESRCECCKRSDSYAQTPFDSIHHIPIYALKNALHSTEIFRIGMQSIFIFFESIDLLILMPVYSCQIDKKYPDSSFEDRRR